MAEGDEVKVQLVLLLLEVVLVVKLGTLFRFTTPQSFTLKKT